MHLCLYTESLKVGNKRKHTHTIQYDATAYETGRSGQVVSVSDRDVRRPMFESHHRQLCLLWQPLRYTALSMGCTPLLQCLRRLKPSTLRRTVKWVSASELSNNKMAMVDVDGSSLLADSQPKSLVWSEGWHPSDAESAYIKWTEWTLAVALGHDVSIKAPQISSGYYYYTHTNSRLMALCPGLPGWAGTRKVKPIRILLKQETVNGSGISWAKCKSAPRSRQITTPATHHSAVVPLPLTVSCFSKIQIGFTFLVPAHPGSPEKGPLKGCVCGQKMTGSKS